MKKIKTTFTALISLFAIFAMAVSMLVFPAKGNANATASDPNKVHVSELFSFTDTPAATKTFIGQADSLPDYATDGSLLTRTGGTGYSDYTNKGAYIALSKSNDETGNPSHSAWTSDVTNVNNVVRTNTFSLNDNTKNDALISYIPLPSMGSRYQMSGENGAKTAKNLLQSDPAILPTARDFYIKMVDATNPDNWLRFFFDYRDSSKGADGSYEFANLLMYSRVDGTVKALDIQRGGTVGQNIKENGVGALIPDTAWLKYNTMNRLYYDAAENAMYADITTTGDNDPVTKALIRDFDYDYGDGFVFNFESVYLEMYFVGGAGITEYLIEALDGVSLATDEEGYLSREAVVGYNNNDDSYFTIPATTEFSIAKEYSLPALVTANMFTTTGADVNATKQYYVTVTDGDGKACPELLSGLNDGRWTESAKFTPVKEGNYVIKYTKGNSFYTLNATITKDKTVSELFTVDSGITLAYNKTAPSFMASGQCAGTGLGLSWTTGGTITINKEFDASQFTLDRPIVEFAVTPKVKSTYTGDQAPESEYEFDNLTVKLTDSENEKIYVTFYINASRFGNTLAFGSVAANDQQYANDKKNKNSPFGTFASNNGVTITSAWSGTTTNTTKMYYDSATHETAYAPSTYKNTTALSGSRFMMRDLDLEDHLIGSDVPFGGFTSGKVKLSITVSDALHDDASMIIYGVMGQTISGEVVEDVTAPEITDEGGFLSVLPEAQIGVNFPFPKTTAYDTMSGDRTAQMWATLTDPDGANVAIDGAGFVPTKVGTYTYTVYANDESLNVSSLAFPIKAVKKLPSLYLTLKDVNGNAYEYPLEAKVGESVKTPVYTVGGGSGNKTVDYTVTDPEGKLVDISTSTINFTKQGLYTARYVVTDYLGVPKTYEFFTSVSYSDTPVISDVNVPVAILAGKTVTLPKPTAYDYYSYIGEQREAAVEVVVTEPGKEPVTLGSDLTFTPSVESGIVKVEYKAKALLDSSKVSPAKTYYTEVIKPATTGEYFITDGFSLGYQKVDRINYEAVYTTALDGASMTFVNPLPAIGFSVALHSLESTELNVVDIVLTDTVNPDQKVIITVTADTTSSTVSINGGEAKLASGTFSATNTFKLSIKSGYKLMDVNNNSLGIITKTVYGETFSGFTSGKVYMDIIVKEVGISGASFTVRDLVNQSRFDNELTDKQAPYITLDYEYTLYNTFGSDIVLSKAVAADVLDPNAKITLTVEAPDGTKILNNVSADENRTLKLDKYGTYKLEYKAIDAGNKSSKKTYNIVSYDNVKPVIEIEGTVKTSYKVGDKLKLNNVRATDNVSATEDMIVYAMITEHFTSNVETYVVSAYGVKDADTGETPEFTFKKAGTYTLKFYVRDSSYNFAQAEFTVTVTE